MRNGLLAIHSLCCSLVEVEPSQLKNWNPSGRSLALQTRLWAELPRAELNWAILNRPVSWIFLLLLLLCAPAFFLAAVGLLLGVATLALGFIAIWATLFALLAAVGVETGMATLAAFGLAFPVGWVVLKWVPEPETDKWRLPLQR